MGETFDVVVTGWGKQPGTQTGRTPGHRIVNFPVQSDPVTLGEVTPVRIVSALSYSLFGELQ